MDNFNKQYIHLAGWLYEDELFDDLSLEALLILSRIISFYTEGKGKNYYNSYESMARWCRCSEKTILRAVQTLREKGFIVMIEERKGRTNIYNLSDLVKEKADKMSEVDSESGHRVRTPLTQSQDTPDTESSDIKSILKEKLNSIKKFQTEKKQMTEEEWYESEERKNLFQLIDDDIFKEEVQEVLINQDVLLNSFKYEKYDSSNDFHQFIINFLSEKKSEKNLQNQSEKQKDIILKLFNKNYGVDYPHVNKIRLTNNASSVVIDETKAAAIKQEEAEKYQKEKEYWFNQINNSRNLNEVIKCLYAACKYYGFDLTSILAQAGMNKHSITMNMLDDISKYQDYNTVQIYIRGKYELAA